MAGGHTLLPAHETAACRGRTRWSISAASPNCAAFGEEDEKIVIGAMTPHAEVATSALVKQGDPRARRRWPARSATGMCAIAARSAARSPTMIRPRTIPPPCSASARPSSPTSARSPPMNSLSRCMRRRSRPARLSRAYCFRSLRSRLTQNSAARPRAFPSSASSLHARRKPYVWSSPVQVQAACSARTSWKQR